jgi:prevent-host-death family protein
MKKWRFQKPSAESKIREVGVYEAKTHFSELLEQAANGQVFVITKHGKPIAELRGTSILPAETGARKAGFWMGRNVVMAPDFDAPLPEFREYM